MWNCDEIRGTKSKTHSSNQFGFSDKRIEENKLSVVENGEQ